MKGYSSLQQSRDNNARTSSLIRRFSDFDSTVSWIKEGPFSLESDKGSEKLQKKPKSTMNVDFDLTARIVDMIETIQTTLKKSGIKNSSGLSIILATITGKRKTVLF
jgi:hypothetical protein